MSARVSLLVGRVHEREQVADRDRRDARRLQLARPPAHRILVERLEHGAGVVGAPGDLARQALRRDRRRLLHRNNRTGCRRAPGSGFLHGAEALRDQEPDLGAAHFQERIGGDGRAVGEELDRRQDRRRAQRNCAMPSIIAERRIGRRASPPSRPRLTRCRHRAAPDPYGCRRRRRPADISSPSSILPAYSRVDAPRQNAAPRDPRAVLALACGISIVAGAQCANA